MHPSIAELISLCDGETGASRGRDIAKHLAACQKCSAQLTSVRGERAQLSARATTPEEDLQQGLSALMSTMANWQKSPAGAGAAELKVRLRSQIEVYFGSQAVSVVERPGMRAEAFLGKTSELFDVFLGGAASEAVMDEALGELDCARAEASR